MVGIEVLNVGTRSFQIGSVGWRTGWLSIGPEALKFRYALQNTSVMVNEHQYPCSLDPGRNQGFYTLIADMKGANADNRNDGLFDRPLGILGHAPIWAMVNITGRKPIFAKVPLDLADFLRTKVHHNTTADD